LAILTAIVVTFDCKPKQTVKRLASPGIAGKAIHISNGADTLIVELIARDSLVPQRHVWRDWHGHASLKGDTRCGRYR